MTNYGVTTTGFVRKTLSIIEDELKVSQRDKMGSTLALLASTVFGQLNGIVADKFRELWDVALAVYNARYPDSASDAALDGVASITKALRLVSQKSTVTLDQLYIDDGVTVTTGSAVSAGEQGPWFILAEDVTNATGAPGTFSGEAASLQYGEIVGNADTLDTIQTPISGWSAKVGLTCVNAEPFNLDGMTLTLKVDGGAIQTVTFAAGDPWSAADVATQIAADTTGLTSVDANTYPRIISDLDGTGSSIEVTGGAANAVLGFVTDVIQGFNSEDAELGREIETDPDFRVRRTQTVRLEGSGSIEAIRADLLNVTDVIQAIVFENVEDGPDSEGLPAKSIEAVVLDGDDADIADALWSHRAGIKMYGTTIVAKIDSMGFSHDIGFSRPTPVRIYQEMTVLTDPNTFPVDGSDQIKTACVLEGETLAIGEDVIALKHKAVPLTIAGVIDVTIFTIDTVAPAVASVNIDIGSRSLSTWDTGDIVVNILP